MASSAAAAARAASPARIAQLAVWQWLAFAFGLGICASVVYASCRLARWLARRGEIEEGVGLHSLLTPLAIVAVMAFLIPLLAAVLRIGDTPRMGTELVRTVVLYLAAAWLVLVGGGDALVNIAPAYRDRFIGRYLAGAAEVDHDVLNDQVWRGGKRRGECGAGGVVAVGGVAAAVVLEDALVIIGRHRDLEVADTGVPVGQSERE